MSAYKFDNLQKYLSNPENSSGFEFLLRGTYKKCVGSEIEIDELLSDTLKKLRHDFAYHLRKQSLDSDFLLTENKVKSSYNFFCWMIRFRQGGVVSVRKKSEYFAIRSEIFKEYYLLRNNTKKVKGNTILCSDGMNRFISYFHPVDENDYRVGRTDLKNTKIEIIKKVEVCTKTQNVERLHPYILKYCEVYLEFRNFSTPASDISLDKISPQKIIDYITHPHHYYRKKNSLCKYYHDPHFFNSWAIFFEKCFKNMCKSINDKKNKVLYFNTIRVIISDDLIKKLT